MPITSRFASAAARAYGFCSFLIKDIYFNYVTLLLPGNGTNGAQNNTFLDSSSNAFTITRNGNTTQGTFSPFSQTGWSNYFGGAGNYLSNSSAALIGVTTTTFTAEAWIFMTAAPTTDANNLGSVITLDGQAAAALNYNCFGPQSSQKLVFRWFDGASKSCTGSTTIPLNTWTHIALVVNANAIAMYVNGAAETLTGTTTLTNRNGTASAFAIAAHNYSSFSGYISNLRVTTTAVYTAAFTPTTTPLTAITGTVLLTSQSNRFVDNSSNAYALTVGGSPSVQAFSPFAPTAAYSASTVGGSGYFDGSGDSLNTTATQIIPATTTYTVEAWIYPTNVSALREIVNQGNNNTVNQFFFYINTTGDLRVLMKTTTFSSGYTVIPNTWTHVAFVSNAGAYTFYVNGVSVASGTGALAPQNTTVYVGTTQGGIEPFLGWISNVRISDTARYTSNFTLPTAPFTSDGNTRLLLSATNGGITDATAKNNLETLGNAQISTTQSKFGGSSMYFDGTGDSLRIAPKNSVLYTLGTDFTVECWINFSVVSGSGTVIVGNINSSGYGDWAFFYNASVPALRFLGNNAVIVWTSSSWTPTAGTWYHVALSRYNGTWRFFVNGVQYGSGSDSTTITFNSANSLYVGTANDAASLALTGYIDDLRVTPGIARYTSNFTPPTSAFLLQ